MKNKEQFSIALWDRLKKDNIPHSFETRDGNKVEQLTLFNTNDDQPLIAVVNNEIESWCNNGNYSFHNTDMNYDLFIVWEEEQLMLEGIVDIYPNNVVVFNLNNATPFRSNAIIARVKVSIPYTKGEGLNNPKSN